MKINLRFTAFIIFTFYGTTNHVFAQQYPEKIIIDSIKLQGNHKTKDYIILRELDIYPGSTIERNKIDSLLKLNRNRIFNTQLFNSVDLILSPVDSSFNLLILVNERWYIFPSLIFELADRNFNEWWYDRGRDLRRVNYGAQIAYKNFRGRNETIRSTTQFGFTKRINFSYSLPYIDKSLKNGLSFYFSYIDNKQVAYRSGIVRKDINGNIRDTLFNKLDYTKSESILRTRFNASIIYTRRSKFYSFHEIDLGFNYNTINDTIAYLNPDYFGNARTIQNYLYLTYNFTFDRRDNVVYTLSGKYFGLEAGKLGFGNWNDLNQWYFLARYWYYKPLGKKYFFSTGVSGRILSPSHQPYYNTRALGYYDLVRGYDLYVIDGQHFALSKFTFKRELIKFKKSLPTPIPKQFRSLPFEIYLRTYIDVGYVWDKQHIIFNKKYSNTLMTGGGLGVDVVTFYSLVIGFDYSVNKDLQKNFFLRLVKDI